MRRAVGAVGVVAIAFGAFSVLAHLLYHLPALVLWLALPLAVHDGLVVPAVLGGAWLVRRRLPERFWGPVVIGAVMSGALLLIALADLVTPATGTVPGLLDRAYGWGLLVALAVTWASVAVVIVARRRAPVA